jgi:hypothetical protein
MILDKFANNYPKTLHRFQEVQRTGVRKEKESIERARAVTYRPPDGDLPSSYNQFQQQQQQQVVLPMDQQENLQGIKERADHLRQLEV